MRPSGQHFSNFGSLKSTETTPSSVRYLRDRHFSNFGSLKSTETREIIEQSSSAAVNFSNFGSLKSTETLGDYQPGGYGNGFQQFRLVEEH